LWNGRTIHKKGFVAKVDFGGSMSACTVWELILTLAVVVSAGFALHYRTLASRMKTRARIYIQYVPREQLTGEERVVLDNFKKELGLK
jgi:hypothetical protein